MLPTGDPFHCYVCNQLTAHTELHVPQPSQQEQKLHLSLRELNLIHARAWLCPRSSHMQQPLRPRGHQLSEHEGRCLALSRVRLGW